MKCKSCFYHIPYSIPIKNFFEGLKDSWFLRLDATCIEHVRYLVAPMTNTIITKQRNNPGKPFVTSVGGIQEFAEHGSLVGRECFRLTPNSLSDHCEKIIIPSPPFKKSRELNHMPLPQDGDHGYLRGKLIDSTSNANNVLDCPKSGNHMTFEGKRTDNDRSRRQNE